MAALLMEDAGKDVRCGTPPGGVPLMPLSRASLCLLLECQPVPPSRPPRLSFQSQGQGKGIRINSQGGLWGVLKDSALYEGLTAAPKPAPPAGAPARKPVKLDTVAAKVSVPGLPLLERERAVEGARHRGVANPTGHRLDTCRFQ